MTNTAQVRREAKISRFVAAETLGTPDRVPTFTVPTFFPTKMTGMTVKDAFYDQEKLLEAYHKYLEVYDPDMYFGPNVAVGVSGAALDILETKQIMWPGNGVDDNASFQLVEGEYMTQAEYDQFLNDSSDFNLRVYLPRVHNALAGFGKFPPLLSIANGYNSPFIGAFADPKILQSLKKIVEAAEIQAKWMENYAAFEKEAAEHGHVNLMGGIALAPFDLISDMLRGMKGTMFDMFQEPDKLLAAQDKFLPLAINSAIGMTKAANNPRVFIPLHRGADGFMSNKQFEKFYWPHLKKIIEAITDAGCIAYPFFEGTYDERLEYLQELPSGKTVAWFDRSDMVRVKEVLGGKLCIAGGMPITLLQASTVAGVKEYTKDMIDTVGRDGGFIMTPSSVLDEAEPALVKAWHDAVNEFGVY
ncbi:MAG TPA: uroporphyrinogen decarboxylase family protein [Oscillospiraceae bacterium]|nr:uroporphyrinogen decarboxylase family protein [Oscillospiraceae bacterium]